MTKVSSEVSEAQQNLLPVLQNIRDLKRKVGCRRTWSVDLDKETSTNTFLIQLYFRLTSAPPGGWTLFSRLFSIQWMMTWLAASKTSLPAATNSKPINSQWLTSNSEEVLQEFYLISFQFVWTLGFFCLLILQCSSWAICFSGSGMPEVSSFYSALRWMNWWNPRKPFRML